MRPSRPPMCARRSCLPAARGGPGRQPMTTLTQVGGAGYQPNHRFGFSIIRRQPTEDSDSALRAPVRFRYIPKSYQEYTEIVPGIYRNRIGIYRNRTTTLSSHTSLVSHLSRLPSHLSRLTPLSLSQFIPYAAIGAPWPSRRRVTRPYRCRSRDGWQSRDRLQSRDPTIGISHVITSRQST